MAMMKALKLVKENKKGQSIIEYLVVVGVIIFAILALKTTGFQGTVANVYNTAANRIVEARGNSSAPPGAQGLTGLTGNWPQGM